MERANACAFSSSVARPPIAWRALRQFLPVDNRLKPMIFLKIPANLTLCQQIPAFLSFHDHSHVAKCAARIAVADCLQSGQGWQPESDLVKVEAKKLACSIAAGTRLNRAIR